MIIENANFSPISLGYFSLKFKELEHLYIRLINAPTNTVERWWKPFIKFFGITKRNNVCMRFSIIMALTIQLEVFLNTLTQILNQHLTKTVYVSVDFLFWGKGKLIFEINQWKCHISLRRNESRLLRRILQCLCRHCSSNEISFEFKGSYQVSVLDQAFRHIPPLNTRQHYSKFLKIRWEAVLGAINTIESELTSNITFKGIIFHGDPSFFFTHLNQSSKGSLDKAPFNGFALDYGALQKKNTKKNTRIYSYVGVW